MKKKLLSFIIAAIMLPNASFAAPYGYREYMRPYEEGTAVFKQENLTVYLNTDIQVELYRPVGTTTKTSDVSYNDAEIKTTVKYDLGDDRYIVGHADIDAYKGTGSSSYRTQPLGQGDDVWIGAGNKVGLIKMGRFATPSAYFGASMAVEGTYSGIFSRGLYPILQSDQSIALYTKPAKGWMANAAYILEDEFNATKGSAYDIAVTHFTKDGFYAQAMLQHENVNIDPITLTRKVDPFTAYGMTMLYKPHSFGIGGSWSNKTNDGQVYQAVLIKDIPFGDGDACTVHFGYGFKDYNVATNEDVSGWYANVMYVIPQAKNINIFGQIMHTDDKTYQIYNDNEIGFVVGTRITL